MFYPSEGGIAKSSVSDSQTVLISPENNPESSLEPLLERIATLEEVSEILVNHHLNKKQLELLSRMKENEGLLYYRLVEKIAAEQKMPASTVRWNLDRLRRAHLVVTGDRNDKGIPVRLTEFGKVVASAFESTSMERGGHTVYQ